MEFWRDVYDARFQENPEWGNVKDSARVKAQVDALIAMTDVAPTDAVVDLGCGAGMQLAELARRGYTDTLGIEYAQSKADWACKALANQFPPEQRPEVLQGDMRGFVPDIQIDLVTMFDTTFGVFGRIGDAEMLVRILSWLRPGGWLFIEALSPFYWATQAQAINHWPDYLDGEVIRHQVYDPESGRLFDQSYYYDLTKGTRVAHPPQVLRLYTPAELREMALEAGFMPGQLRGDREFELACPPEEFCAKRSSQMLCSFQKPEVS